ncbi:MAG: bifunctional diaminohydroxyphosphoribosylaminopyrimidine deaminase/5-amino-6-(5-phosphoribosylamino)uracil reductase RibD [Candidatus Omnitrophota bacterium]
MKEDEYYMSCALRLAGKAFGRTSPNPMVGAVLVKNGRIVGSGYHRRAGLPHAEAEAIKAAGQKARGAALYVNLEPCNHYGKTPPCTDAILKAGVKRVVAAMKDPNPVNNGAGLRRLKRRGLSVRTGVLKKEAEELNRNFIAYITKKRPFVMVKVAQSVDGKIATRSGDSKWISSDSSRHYAHRLRARFDAVMIGVNTLLKDNPILTTRRAGRQPVKIIVDSSLRTPPDSRIFTRVSPGRVIIATAGHSAAKNAGALKKKADILYVGSDGRKVNMKRLLTRLAKEGITSVLVEGGGELAWSLIEKKLVDRIMFIVAPMVIGGRDAVTSVEGKGYDRVKNALSLRDIKMRRIKQDILLEAKPCLRA